MILDFICREAQLVLNDFQSGSWEITGSCKTNFLRIKDEILGYLKTQMDSK